MFLKISQYLQNINHMCQSLFLSCHFIKKETLLQRFPCEFCKIFWSTFFSEHLFMTAFILQQLLALYIAIIYSWKLLRSEKALVGKKNSFIYLNDFTDLDFFITDIFFFFSFFFWQLQVYTVMQSACCTLSSQSFCWLGDT